MQLRELADIGHVKQRTCLKCGKAFGSTGVGNRLCDACNKQNSQNRYRIEKIIKDDRRRVFTEIEEI